MSHKVVALASTQIKKIMGLSIASLLGLSALVGVGISHAVTNNTYKKVEYKFSGINENWLLSHNVDNKDNPSQFNPYKDFDLKTPSIIGYHFDGWYLNSECIGNTLKGWKTDNDCILEGKFTPNSYTCKLNLNGGFLTNLSDDNSFDSHVYSRDEKGNWFTSFYCFDDIFTLPTSYRYGYDAIHSGWKDSVVGDLIYSIDPSKCLDKELSSDWVIHPYSIQYSFNGEGVSEFEAQIINNNTKIADYDSEVVLVNPYLKGYNFVGWHYKNSTSKISKIEQNSLPTGDCYEIVGEFEPIVYQISYVDKSHTDLSKFPTSYKRCSPNIPIPTLKPRGYTFKGWISDEVTSFEYTHEIPHDHTGDITLTSDVNLLTYHITFAQEGIDDAFISTFSLLNKTITYTVETNDFTLPEATCPGYNFLGFFDANGNLFGNTVSKGVNACDFVLTARFEPITYQLTLNNTKGTQSVIDYTIESSFCLLNPSCSGYAFEGWKDENGSVISEICKGDAASKQSFTLTSTWKLISYTITFECEGIDDDFTSLFSLANKKVKYTVETNDFTLPEATCPGYNFLGFFLENGNPFNATIAKGSMVGDKHLIAKFEPTVYTISLNNTKGKSSSINYTVEDSKSLPNVSCNGYTFEGWRDDNGNLVSLINKGDAVFLGNFTVTSTWQIVMYTISFVSEGIDEDFLSSFTLLTTKVKYTVEKDDFTLPEAVCPGYEFLGFFTENGNAFGPTITKGSIFGDKVITAKFKPIVYTITLNNSLGKESNVKYTIEDSVTFQNPSSTGYTFDGWFDSNNKKVSSIAKGDAVQRGNFTVEAKWTLITYSISYAYSGLTDGTVVENNNPLTYDYETSISLENLTCTGYDFNGWTSSSITTPSKNVFIESNTTTGDLNFTANFKKKTYSVKTSYNQNGSGALISTKIDYDVDTKAFCLPIPESKTRVFLGWENLDTHSLYTSTQKFGGGQVGDYNLLAKWGYIGEGTKSNPYQIFDGEQLENISEMDKCYIIMNDITITSSQFDVWHPIGNIENGFTGSLDGNNKKITMIMSSSAPSNDPLADDFGIFTCLGEGSSVYNLTLDGSIGASDNRFPCDTFGCLASFSQGNIENVDCDVRCFLTSNNADTAIFGSLVGSTSGSIIKECEIGNTDGIINVQANKTETVYVGGIVGTVSGGGVLRCLSSSNVISSAKNESFAGGFVGSRDGKDGTHISAKGTDPFINPFKGSVSSSVVSSEGNIGMSQYEGGDKCIVGKQLYKDAAPITSEMDIGDYYYTLYGYKSNPNTLGVAWCPCVVVDGKKTLKTSEDYRKYAIEYPNVVNGN